jgi:hypothetical protein
MAAGADRVVRKAEGIMECAKHPRVDTYVRCGRCDRPICPRCMVASPVGMRCRGCAYQRSPLNQASAIQYLRAGVAALVAGVALGWMSLLLFWLGAAYGYLIGEIVLRAGGRRRGPGMQLIAGVGAVLGALLWRLPGFGEGHRLLLLGVLMLVTSPFALVAIGLGVCFAILHVRNL